MEAAHEHVYIWHPEQALWITVLWDAPTTADISEMVRLHDSAYDSPASFDSVVDFSGVTAVDPVAFDVLMKFALRRKADFDRQIRKQALVRPGGMIGALVTGFFESFGFAMPVRTFEERSPALAWVRPDEAPALERELDRRVAAARARSPWVERLRDLLAKHHDASVELRRFARLLGTTERTLQRQLGVAGTSFRAELSRARIEASKLLLQAADCKLDAVAREVGSSTLQSFAAAFRHHTGESPGQWRARWRGGTR